MQEKHQIQDLMGVTMEKIRDMVDVQTIIGDPIVVSDTVTIIPVSKVSYGFASGGSDLPAKSTPKDLFGGGAGAGGGLSNKGAGEKKLELDRRRIEKRISELNRELKVMEKDRETQRKRRKESELPSVALVGYTNAGKSTLMNKMLDIWMGDTEKRFWKRICCSPRWIRRCAESAPEITGIFCCRIR